MVKGNYGSRLMVHDSRFDKKAEKLMTFILNGYSGNKVKDTWQVAKIFPWKAVRYAPSIFLNVNWLKVKERLFAKTGEQNTGICPPVLKMKGLTLNKI